MRARRFFNLLDAYFVFLFATQKNAAAQFRMLKIRSIAYEKHLIDYSALIEFLYFCRRATRISKPGAACAFFNDR